MTAASIDSPPPGGWSVDDLDDLPEDGRKRELLDGVLLMSPSPTSSHQIIAGRLMVFLEESCPPEYVALQSVDVRLGRQRSFSPDVLAVTDEAASRRGQWYAPHEVVLAVEIVSASSRAMDRITKPALYAQAGIPHYWRIEVSNRLTVHTNDLEPDQKIYRPTGQWTDAIKVELPWPIDISIARLTPRYLHRS